MTHHAPDDVLQNAGLRTQREWRQLKRKHVKAARMAMEQLLRGCMYTPHIGIHIGAMLRDLRRLEEAWSQTNWGKKP